MVSEYGKVGLVLSGGGAKGAYQIGVLKALVQFGVPVHAIAGASIGALNGAILACAPNLTEGVERLEKIWLELAHSSLLKSQIPSYIQLLIASGIRENVVVALLHSLISLAQGSGLSLPEELHKQLHQGIMDDTPIKALMDKYLDYNALTKGIPLYISVFRSYGGLLDILRVIAAELRLMESSESEFIHIQSTRLHERRELILASAAIPIVFTPRQVKGTLYSDGGQGGWIKSQGNTPITPLIKAGCDVVIVTHLSDGSLWSRHDFPNTIIVEVRPQEEITRDTTVWGGIKDLLSFDQNKINSWIAQGYADTQHSINQIVQASKSRQQLKASEKALVDSEKNNSYADSILHEALTRLL